MIIKAISDTHNKHGFISMDEVDMIIHSGDCSIQKNPSMNHNEVLDFIEWYKNYPAKYKIFIPGNHDTSIASGSISKEEFIDNNIILLNHEFIEIEKLKIFGSPYTPEFGNGWAYNVKPNRIHNYWEDIPNDLDILITHGPPKGILDLTYYRGLNQCGCKSLYDTIIKVKPKYHLFGHIHNEKNVENAGIFKSPSIYTTFINSTTVNLDYSFNNDGIIFNI